MMRLTTARFRLITITPEWVDIACVAVVAEAQVNRTLVEPRVSYTCLHRECAIVFPQL